MDHTVTAAPVERARSEVAVDTAFGRCERIARAHYENFTLGLRLLPRDLGRHVVAIYAYARTADACSYCAYSANPVGHLVLHLFGHDGTERQARADDICTALRLTNFWQDVPLDYAKGRIYFPADDLTRFGYFEAELAARRPTRAFRALMAFECARTRELFQLGLSLVGMVGSAAGREIRLFAAGGLAILDRLAAVDYDVFTARPTLRRWAKISLVARTLLGVRA